MVLSVSLRWKVRTSQRFNAVALGKLFKETNESIVAVGEDGVVHVYTKPFDSLENEKLSVITVCAFYTMINC